MTSRRLLLVATFAAIGCSRAASAPPAPAPAQGSGSRPSATASTRAPQDTGRGAGAQQGPRPYAQVITKEATTDSGVFHVHRIQDKLYYEIPRAMLGREFRLVVDRRGTVRGVGYAGEEISDRVIRWERMGSRVLLRMVSYAMRADSTLPVSRAVDLSNTAPIIKAFDIAAWSC